MYFRPPSNVNGISLEQRPTSFSGNLTQWKEVTRGEGYFYLQNRGTGLYFRPTGGSINDNLIQRPTSYRGSFTQWRFQSVNQSKNLINSRENFKVYPNPVSRTGVLKLAASSSENMELNLMNLSGVSMYTKQINNESDLFIDMNTVGNISSGLYVLQVIESGDVVKIIRLVIK